MYELLVLDSGEELSIIELIIDEISLEIDETTDELLLSDIVDESLDVATDEFRLILVNFYYLL